MITAQNDVNKGDRTENGGNKGLLSVIFKKGEILSTLRLIADEPNYYSDLFGYKEYSDRLFELLSFSLPDKPFAICLDGKWGEGKTSLLKRIHNKLLRDSKITNNRAIWFDAWKHEDIAPTIALLHRILDLYPEENTNQEKLQNLLQSLCTWYYRTGTKEKDKSFELNPAALLKRVIYGMENLVKDLDILIGDDKVFIFIDHLDRCKVDYVGEILKAISAHLSSSRIKFIVGVDMGRLESMFQDRGAGQDSVAFNQSGYLDKIFQLKLVLPSKDDIMMRAYVETVAGRFPKAIQDFLAHALPRNPRRVKEALNLAFYVSTLVEEEEYSKMFPYILAWSVLATSFHNLSSIVHRRPETLFDMSIIVSQTTDYAKFIDALEVSKADDNLFYINTRLPKNSVNPLAIKLCYSHVMHDEALYHYLKTLKAGLELDLVSKSSQVESMMKAIKYVGLLS